MANPRNHLTGIQPERQRCSERESRVLAKVVVQCRIAHLDGPILDGIEHLQAGDNFACGESLNLEFVVGDLGHTFGEIFAAAIKGIERLWPTCGQPPFHFRR